LFTKSLARHTSEAADDCLYGSNIWLADDLGIDIGRTVFLESHPHDESGAGQYRLEHPELLSRRLDQNRRVRTVENDMEGLVSLLDGAVGLSK
jgi:hypothetical protein